MEEPYERPIRVRRVRRRRSVDLEPVYSGPAPSNLAWLGLALVLVSLLLFVCLMDPSGVVGVGTVHPSFTMGGSEAFVSNTDADSWSGVSIRAIGPGLNTGESLDGVDAGRSEHLSNVGSGPALIWVRSKRPGGFWIGIAH